jgi:hypothetical protein
MKDLVSATLSNTALNAIIADLADIKSKMPFMVPLTPKERKDYSKKGDKSAAYVEKGFQFAQANPNALPANFDAAEYESDHTLEGQLVTILAAIDQLREDVSDTRLAAGVDLMGRTGTVYDLIKVLSKKDGTYDTERQSMGARFKGQGKKKNGAAKTTANA